ncbi:MAG: hypothetical protein U9R12_04400 [Candidatus Caldatribacteriota bacterium]|nr:hypothetical protein [Candidatus Caldatribacteriota bacterium]
MTNDRFMEVKGEQCPYCFGLDVKQGGASTEEKNKVFVHMECENCGKKYMEEYDLTGWVEIDTYKIKES